MDGYVSKPVRAVELLSAMQAAMAVAVPGEAPLTEGGSGGGAS
jgi:hypothetical protein